MHYVLAHFLGDWIFQTDYMGLPKKESSWICLLHVSLYMILFLWVPGMVWWKFLLIAAQHYAIDRTHFIEWYLSKTGRKNFLDKNNPMWPGGMIVHDQILHLAWIAGVMAL